MLCGVLFNMKEINWKEVVGLGYYIITFLAGAGVILLLFTLSFKIYDRELEPIKVQVGDVYPSQGELRDFLIVGQRFSEQHDYTVGEYDCQNYTRELYDIATSLGFEVKKVRGCPEQDNATCHAWLKLVVDYEPQHNTIMDYSKKYPDQEDWE